MAPHLLLFKVHIKSEAKYELFLLEFAALKYSLDEFESYIYGSPIEIETDCQASETAFYKRR